MKLSLKKLALSLSLLLIVLLATHCNSNSTSQSGLEGPEDPNIVAKIDQYVITKGQLEKRLFSKLYPDRYNLSTEEPEPADAKSVLLEMIAEKAMILEAREQGYLENETVYAPVKRNLERNLINLLAQNYVKEMKDKITATEEEIEKRMQADPNSNPKRVKALIENTKARNYLSSYYNQLYQKFHVKKLSENFPQAIKIHDRLLNHPKTPQRMKYIRNSQIMDEMTPEERNIVLATYDYGKVTLEDWFITLCVPSPPSRPRNLNTLKGVEQMLNTALMTPIFLAEAKLQNLDKDETYLKLVRSREDEKLSRIVQNEKYKQVKEPTNEEIIAYYNKNKEAFRTGRFMKIDVIWCEDLNTAKQVKKELDKGKDFESARQEYSLAKNSKASNAHPSSEGLFWKDLWNAEPNEIIGPIKGFYNQQIKWRIVKILEKKTGEIKEYSEDMNNRIKSSIKSEQSKAILTEYGRQLLKKYPYKIYTNRIKNIDPLDIK